MTGKRSKGVDWLWWVAFAFAAAKVVQLLVSPVRHSTTLGPAEMRDPRFVGLVFGAYYARGFWPTVAGCAVTAAETAVGTWLCLGGVRAAYRFIRRRSGRPRPAIGDERPEVVGR